MVFVVWVFTFKDKWIKYLCGVVNFVVGAMTFLLTGENFILFAILYPLLFIGIVTITENINSPMVYPPRQKICFRNVIRTNRIMTTVTSFLLFLSIITLCIPVNAPAQLCLNEFTDVTKQFIGETITVRSTAEQTGAFNNFMSANLDQNGIVRFNRTTPGSWERFYVNASADGSWISLRADNGRYVSTQHHRQHAPLVADANIPRLWEEFRIFERDGRHYLFTRMHNIFITASVDKGHVPAEARYPNRTPTNHESLLIQIVR